MMFSALFRKKDSKDIVHRAEGLYAEALMQTREPFFYTEMDVPDTFDGRFDLLLLNIFIILHKYYDSEDYKGLSQALFDTTFKDMDQTLREMGIGDMGIPKHMRRMMKAFNGRMHYYMAAVSPEKLDADILAEINKSTLAEVLMRNLYGSCKEAPDQDSVQKMERYILENIKSPLDEQQFFISYQDKQSND